MFSNYYTLLLDRLPKTKLTIERAIEFVRAGEKPQGINEYRWNAIVVHINREYINTGGNDELE